MAKQVKYVFISVLISKVLSSVIVIFLHIKSLKYATKNFIFSHNLPDALIMTLFASLLLPCNIHSPITKSTSQDSLASYSHGSMLRLCRALFKLCLSSPVYNNFALLHIHD